MRRFPLPPFSLGAGPLWRRVWRAPVLALIWFYRAFITPMTPASCIHEPTCSRYAEEAIQVHGLLLGGWYAGRRLVRCNPWARGGPDPVPPPRRQVMNGLPSATPPAAQAGPSPSAAASTAAPTPTSGA